MFFGATQSSFVHVLSELSSFSWDGAKTFKMELEMQVQGQKTETLINSFLKTWSNSDENIVHFATWPQTFYLLKVTCNLTKPSTSEKQPRMKKHHTPQLNANGSNSHGAVIVFKTFICHLVGT